MDKKAYIQQTKANAKKIETSKAITRLVCLFNERRIK